MKSTLDSQLGDPGVVSIVIAALFLSGVPRSTEIAPRRWPSIVHRIRSHPTQRLCEIGDLFRAYRWNDAAAIVSDTLLLRRIQCLSSRRAFLTVVDAEYPMRWLRVLEGNAPPVVWRLGGFPLSPLVAIVGSRNPDYEVQRDARSLCLQAVAHGYGIITGGAAGVDAIASQTASSLSVLPEGISMASSHPVCSTYAPFSPFTSLRAMERNALVFAASNAAFVYAPRFRQGGTWHAALQGLRRRLTKIYVFKPDSPFVDRELRQAVEPLVALGAHPFSNADDAAEFLSTDESLRAGSYDRQVHSFS